MNLRYLLLPVTALSLIGCSALLPAPSSSNYLHSFFDTFTTGSEPDIAMLPATIEIEGQQKQDIIAAIADQKDDLQLCLDEPELTSESLEFSEVYEHPDGNYLARILCWNAAYQGVYEYVVATPAMDTNELTFENTDTHLVGYPTFDPNSSIIHNTYKFNGAGVCLEETQHYWDGYSVRLLSAELVDGIENGCEEMGMRSPSEDFLITADGVGRAKFGMTLREYRQQMQEGMTLEPTILGVDIPDGLQLSWYGEVQYDLGFDTETITEDSKIELIAVRSTSYKTATGIGAGTPLDAAIAIYGRATLAFNAENEMRESITFEQGLFEGSNTGLWIRSNQWTVTDFAGIYPDSDSSYQTTQSYHDHAAIGSIWLMNSSY